MAINFGGANWRVSGIDDNNFNNNIVSSSKSNRISLKGYNYQELSRYAEETDGLSLHKPPCPGRGDLVGRLERPPLRLSLCWIMILGG